MATVSITTYSELADSTSLRWSGISTGFANIFFRIDDISLDFKINRCSIRLLENQTVTDATGRERLMTLKDYNIKENNVIAMVMKDHTTTNLNGYDENERIVFLFLHNDNFYKPKSGHKV